MILRKPYAFIIKHFKLIHLIILGCLVFCVYTLSGISSLVDTLLNSRTYTYSGADVYINTIIYLFIFISFFLSIVIYILFKKKKKPVGIYLGLVVYNVVLIVLFIYLFNVLRTLINSTVEGDTLRFIRDIIFIVYIPAYLFIFVSFIRGIGFNLKQFNFSKDIAELKIADKDSEEFELMVGQNNYKYLRFIRRTIRETKYYILENMVAISILMIVVSVVLVFFGYKYYKKYVDKVKAQHVTQVEGINYVLNKAYITAEDYNGELIKEGSKFVVLDMTFENVSNQEVKIDLDRLALTYRQLYYKPNMSYNYKFYDLGFPYEKDFPIQPNTYINKYIIFEIPSTTTTTNFTLKVEYGVYSKKNKVFSNFVQFDVNATDIDTEEHHEYLKLRDEIYTNVNGENEFRLDINDFSILENYNDKYVICDKKLQCKKFNSLISANKYPNKSLLVLDYKGTIYDDAKFTKNIIDYNDIFSKFCYIQYQYANRIYTERVTVFPGTNINDKMFLLVDNKVKTSNKVTIYFKFRNNTYSIDLKG